MAATWMHALHVNKGKTIAQTITERTNYAENPDKTAAGELVSGYRCDPMTVDAEFILSKRQYKHITGRDQGSRDVLAYPTPLACACFQMCAFGPHLTG